MSPRFILWRENVPFVAEVVNRSLKADCTDFTFCAFKMGDAKDRSPKKILKCDMDLEMGDAKERSPAKWYVF